MKETIDDILTELSCKGWQEAVHEIEKALEEKNKEIERLKVDYQQANEVLAEQSEEIERLNNELENVKAHYETEAEAKYYEFIDNHESKLQQRIDKTIKYLKSKEWAIDYEKSSCRTHLLEILKGDSNE